MKYLSLFSGIEAASVAWEPLGWEAQAFAEFEAFPSAVLAHHFPATPNLGDVTAVDWEAWLDQNGRPDVMVAGSPCQAFSVAGQRRSLQDARGNLALFTAELVRYLNPRVYIWENVPGVLNTKDNAFGSLLGELSGAGAALVPPRNGKWSNAGMVVGPERRLAWRVLDAQWFGVAQRRRRVFLVASATDGPDPQQILFEPESVRRNTPPSREPREGTATSAESGAGSSSGVIASATQQGGAERLANLCPTITAAAGMAGNMMPWIAEPTVMAPAFSKRPGQQIANRSDGLSYAVTTGAPPSVLPALDTEVCGTLCADTHPGSYSGQDAYSGRLVPAPTVRRLTPLECSRLQGFPDEWARIPWRGKPAEECPDGPQYKAYGNSMAVPVMAWLGARIDAVLNGTPFTYGVPERYAAEIECRSKEAL